MAWNYELPETHSLFSGDGGSTAEPVRVVTRSQFMLKRAFLAYVLVELAVLAGLTWVIGLGWTLLVLLATAAVGFAMAGSQARRQLMRLQQIHTDPRGAVADSALVALGTVLVLIPGLVSSLVGTLMLLPPTRSAIRPAAGVLLARGLLSPAGQVRVMTVGDPRLRYGGGGGPYQQYPADHGRGGHPNFSDSHPGYGDYIDGEIVEGQVYGRVHEANIIRRYES